MCSLRKNGKVFLSQTQSDLYFKSCYLSGDLTSVIVWYCINALINLIMFIIERIQKQFISQIKLQKHKVVKDNRKFIRGLEFDIVYKTTIWLFLYQEEWVKLFAMPKVKRKSVGRKYKGSNPRRAQILPQGAEEESSLLADETVNDPATAEMEM